MPEGKIYGPTVKHYRDEDAPRTQARWWAETESVHTHVLPVANAIYDGLKWRREEWLRYARLYSGRDFVGFGIGQFAKASTRGKSGSKLTLNVIRSCIATAAAKISSKKPRALFLTKGGDYELRERGKLLTKYVDGIFSNANVYGIARDAFVDACVFGLGSVKVFARDGKIRVERVIVDETLIDQEDGRYRDPRQRHQRRYVSREQLLEEFGTTDEAKEAIRKANVSTSATNRAETVAEQIEVTESWHLSSGDDAKDGIHTICIEGFDLLREEYNHPFFPFADITWTDDLLGPYGIGLAEELVGIQVDINKTLRQISRIIELTIPRAFLSMTSRIPPGSLTDEIWSVVRYTGTAPTFSSPAALSPEVKQYLDMLYAKAYEITGISQMQAASKKEPGIDSGVALREMSDIASERFLVIGQKWEEFFLQIARIAIALTRDLAEKDDSFSVKIKDGKDARDVSWLKDINLDEDQYMMDCYPVAFLPTTPAGKLQYIQDIMKIGLVTNKERILQLLDYPDTEEWVGVETAGLQWVQRAISRILDKGEPVQPTKFMPLSLAIELSQAAIMQAEDDGRPQDRIDMLQQFADAAADLEKELNPPAPPPMAGPPGAPPGPMGPPPGGPMPMAA